MDMKSQFYFAYIAGLDPLQVLMKYGPDSYRQSLPAHARDEAVVDLPRKRSPRRRALLLGALALGLAIGAWQLLADTGETKAAELSGQGSGSGRGLLLLVLFLGLMIGGGEFLTRIDGSRSADVSGQSAAFERSVLNA
jgi:hypothetical protein